MQKVSIIVPVYNAEKHIEKCLESLVNQSYSNIEIILVNDGSTDNSEIVIQKYIEKYENKIKYYKKENEGVALTRNFGIEKSTGNYILFVDSDDYIDLDLIKNLSEFFEEDIDLVKFKLQKVDEEGNKLEKIEGPTFKCLAGYEAFDELYDKDILLDSPCLYLIKKELFKENKFTPNTLLEDFGLIPIIIVNSKEVVSTDIYGYYYVQSKQSITRNEDYNKTLKKAYDSLIHYDNMIQKINKSNLPKKSIENIKIFYTNAILLKIETLKSDDQKEYINEIKKRKMIRNIKARNLKQFVKRLLVSVNIKLYLKLR